MLIIVSVVVGAIAAGVVRMLTSSSLFAGMAFFFITVMAFKYFGAH